MLHQGVHAAQQVLMRDRFGLNARHRHRFQPAQHAEFGLRVAQATEDHHPDQRFDIDAVPRLAEHPAQFAETERLPQLVQRPDVAQCACRFELDRRQCRVQHIRPTGGLQQAGNDRVETAAQLIESPERDQRAMLGLSSVIAKRLYELQIFARTGAGDLEEHASTLSGSQRLSNMARSLHDVPLHDFLRKHPSNPHGYVAKRSKIGVLGRELSNSGGLQPIFYRLLTSRQYRRQKARRKMIERVEAFSEFLRVAPRSSRAGFHPFAKVVERPLCA